jgi:hypothetical protein
MSNADDKKPISRSGVEKLNSDMEVVELSVDEQAHVAGGAVDSFLKIMPLAVIKTER